MRAKCFSLQLYHLRCFPCVFASSLLIAAFSQLRKRISSPRRSIQFILDLGVRALHCLRTFFLFKLCFRCYSYQEQTIACNFVYFSSIR
ncbi:hypothetical protein EDC96DRAFT_513319 [Choanephora cucurbitarum]|nr:hypothetical protein EDC96DRAFT_513319 [Choanephora cucurbitarum]